MKKIWLGCLFILVSFYLTLISLMNLFPMWIAFPLLLLSIIATIQGYTNRHRFRGF
ncbi:hypothetical protein [Salipaludibacillus daqingensis]|uniref:hypothetical protein n=1 Tax=Salipaludibacillus daqingensis TaxID=3041001 RepID=UPI0024731C74|nr:hypothetical protein [Salipaludibacillus daqingensis]